MANYTMTHKCGHTSNVNITGAPEKRAIKIAEAEAASIAIDCFNCTRLARVHAEIDAALEAGDEALAQQIAKAHKVKVARENYRKLQSKVGFDRADEIVGRQLHR